MTRTAYFPSFRVTEGGTVRPLTPAETAAYLCERARLDLLDRRRTSDGRAPAVALKVHGDRLRAATASPQEAEALRAWADQHFAAVSEAPYQESEWYRERLAAGLREVK